MPGGTSMSEWTHHRARVASLTRSRTPDDPDLIEARRDLKAERLADYIARTVDAAPPLTPAQRDRLAVLLRGGDHPPDASGATQPDLGANQEGHHPGDYLSVPILARQAAIIVAEKNLPISGSRVRKLVRRFVREGRTDVDFRTWILGYADPTGEKAVRNVMRGAAR